MHIAKTHHQRQLDLERKWREDLKAHLLSLHQDVTGFLHEEWKQVEEKKTTTSVVEQSVVEEAKVDPQVVPPTSS